MSFKRVVADIETNGFLAEVHTIHCLVVYCLDTDEIRAYHNDPTIFPKHGTIAEGIEVLNQADVIAGHNWTDYDGPVLEKLRGREYAPTAEIHDTVVWSRLCFSDRRERDFRLKDQGRLEGRYVGQHSLASWGARFGYPKGDWSSWEKFEQGMLTYCIRDVKVNVRLYRFLEGHLPTKVCGGRTAAQVEGVFADILGQQERTGVQLDRKAGEKLLGKLLARRAELLEEIHRVFPARLDWYKINKRTGKRASRFCKVRQGKFENKLVPFKPTSRMQLADRLQQKYGWVPTELSKKTMRPLMHEKILVELAEVYPEVKLVSEYYIIEDRISLLEEGPSGYFQLCDENDVLHGRTLHIGAVTHRCTHSKPNTGNVTSIRKPYGLEIRELFVPFDGFIQAGFDADGLELVMKAHYLSRYDGGRFTKILLEGNKADGTDAHTLNAAAINEVTPCNRDQGKNFTYAFMYGAGDAKLGAMAGGPSKLGRRIRRALKKSIKGLEPLLDALEERYKQDRNITSLDGRRVGVRSVHALLNTLLQSAGAVVMKWVTVFLHEELLARGVVPGVDYIQTGHIHDEVQGSLRPHLKAEFSEAVTAAFERTTEALGLRCPATGSADFGASWADTH